MLRKEEGSGGGGWEKKKGKTVLSGEHRNKTEKGWKREEAYGTCCMESTRNTNGEREKGGEKQEKSVSSRKREDGEKPGGEKLERSSSRTDKKKQRSERMGNQDRSPRKKPEERKIKSKERKPERAARRRRIFVSVGSEGKDKNPGRQVALLSFPNKLKVSDSKKKTRSIS